MDSTPWAPRAKYKSVLPQPGIDPATLRGNHLARWLPTLVGKEDDIACVYTSRHRRWHCQCLHGSAKKMTLHVSTRVRTEDDIACVYTGRHRRWYRLCLYGSAQKMTSPVSTRVAQKMTSPVLSLHKPDWCLCLHMIEYLNVYVSSISYIVVNSGLTLPWLNADTAIVDYMWMGVWDTTPFTV